MYVYMYEITTSCSYINKRLNNKPLKKGLDDEAIEKNLDVVILQ